MMIKTVRADGASEFLALERMRERSGEIGREADAAARDIIEAVRRDGDAALAECGRRFDGGVPSTLEVGRDEIERACGAADDIFKGALSRAAANIRAYHEKQVAHGYEIRGGGVVLGQVVRGLDRVGLYVPGGGAAYPSTVLMNAIPAKLAGVSELIMATPPMIAGGGKSGAGTRFIANPDILVAARAAGVDRVFLTGGAQAVAAMALGTESIPRVDKITGPGNIYVTAAKKLLYGTVDIDMIAGPSEILIMADGAARPGFIAADMLSQAEHDRNAAAMLLTLSEGLAAEVEAELEVQLARLERGGAARESLETFGLIVICESLGEMTSIANWIAPEHLEIMTEDPMSVLPAIRNAGSVFCGDYAPESLGDYYSGANHVLPTSGTARFASPLGVYDFVKRMSYTYYTENALAAARDDVIVIAEREGLAAHADAIRIRFEQTAQSPCFSYGDTDL